VVGWGRQLCLPKLNEAGKNACPTKQSQLRNPYLCRVQAAAFAYRSAGETHP